MALTDLRLPAGPVLARRSAWLLLSLPLGAVHAGLFVGLVGAGVLAVYGVGLLLLPLVLATARGLGGLERRVVRGLLDVAVAPDPPLRRADAGRARRVRLLLTSSSTWRTVGWLAVRVLLAASTLATLVFGAAGVVLTLSEPPWTLATMVPLLALLVLTVATSTAVLALQVRLAAAAAPWLLGTPPEETIAALQQSSRRLADRNRLARDLHDTIGHALTASLLQATAARRSLDPRADDPAVPVDLAFARQALQHIETGTRAALSELDHALAVLRDEDRAAPGEADLTRLDGLLEALRDGGLPVTLVLETALDALPAPVSALGYRVVQEGTTNVLRHAGCVPTTVQVARDGGALTVRVHNLRAPGAAARPGPGAGRGLDGLRERAAALGGEVVAGATPSGGFEVAATLPLPEAA